MSKLDELKALNEQKKALNEQAKALREEVNAGKTERIEARKAQAAARKAVREQKADLRDLSAKIYTVFSSGDADAISSLAGEIMDSATELSASVSAFGASAQTLENL